MSARLRPRRVADDVFEISVSSSAEAQALAHVLRVDAKAEDVVAGLASVAIRFDPREAEVVASWLQEVSPQNISPQIERPVAEIEISYGGEFGPDFDFVCDQIGVSKDAFIEQHIEREHTVEMIGFTPGFSYISGVPPAWSIPRLSDPRPRVPAGSVGISAGYTGIYAMPGPGGWPLIGRTTATLFDQGASDPFLLAPGQRVKFRPI